MDQVLSPVAAVSCGDRSVSTAVNGASFRKHNIWQRLTFNLRTLTTSPSKRRVMLYNIREKDDALHSFFFCCSWLPRGATGVCVCVCYSSSVDRTNLLPPWPMEIRRLQCCQKLSTFLTATTWCVCACVCFGFRVVREDLKDRTGLLRE